jgi:hypothetical protein
LTRYFLNKFQMQVPCQKRINSQINKKTNDKPLSPINEYTIMYINDTNLFLRYVKIHFCIVNSNSVAFDDICFLTSRETLALF